MICTVLECDQLEESRGMCQAHLRRFIAGLVYENESGYLSDHCAQGHELIEANIRWESSGKKGKRRRRCRECLRDKARRQAKNALKVVEPPKPYRPDDETLTQAIYDFEEATKHVTPKCRDNPGPYIDWIDGGDVPTVAEAEALCNGCPLVRACKNRAIAGNEQDGVWGGGVLLDGVWQ